MLPYRYNWRHIPTGKTGTNVFEGEYYDMLAKLNKWNYEGRGIWVYWY